MPERVDILVGMGNSEAVKGLSDVDQALLKTGSAAQLAEKGISAQGNRLEALHKSQALASGSASELAASWKQQVTAAEAVGGPLAGINARLVALKFPKLKVESIFTHGRFS